MVRPDQQDLAKVLGITPSFLTTHVYYWGDRHVRTILGPQIAAYLTPEQTALKKGLRFTNHMDTPVVPMNPFFLAWITVSRVTSSGIELGPDKRIHALTALRSMTIDATWQTLQEKDRGSIEVGKYSDLIVLSGNPLLSAQTLRDIRVLQTCVGGTQVYERSTDLGTTNMELQNKHVVIAGGFTMGAAVHEAYDAQWDAMMQGNVVTLRSALKAVVPGMLARGCGRVITVGAFSALQGKASMSAYMASKAVVMNLTEALAAEIAHTAIRVNAILPSIIDTPANRASMPDADFSQWVRPQDMAEVICFLASDASQAIHGALIPLNGAPAQKRADGH